MSLRGKKSFSASLCEGAIYEESLWVELTFDRAIDMNALDAAQITVDDGPFSGTLWVGVGSTLIGPATVRIELGEFDPSSSAETSLTAGAGTGIVAVNDGGTWAGVSGLLLPFP